MFVLNYRITFFKLADTFFAGRYSKNNISPEQIEERIVNNESKGKVTLV